MHTPGDLWKPHGHCARNRDEIARSETCGCFYCLEVFPPMDVRDWIDVNGHEEGPPRRGDRTPATALCPRCGIDSVLGSASGFPVDDPEFLRRMHERWF